MSVEDDRLAAIRGADSLAELLDPLNADSLHEAYVRACEYWEAEIRSEQERRGPPDPDELPGDTVNVDGTVFHVHGITHAGTDAERAFLREHVERQLDRGAVVYCEQGIRPLYFEDLSGVCAMDDYRWALAECEKLDGDSHIEPLPEAGIDAVLDDLHSLAGAFREAAFTLNESGGTLYGERFERTLGAIAAGFLTGHADEATGKSYEAFRLRRAASEDPRALVALQRYYERTFLPQPLEREWLRRHDPELEIVSHARNARMADYAVYHNESASAVHLIVGAAHQPGVRYYLERHRDGDRTVPDPFELF